MTSYLDFTEKEAGFQQNTIGAIPPIFICACTYQGVRNVIFLKNFTFVLDR